MNTGKHQNDIADLPRLSNYRLENLFKVYTDANGNYFYNLLNTIVFPEEPDENIYYLWRIPSPNMPWTLISHQIYNTVELWWLLCSLNGIQNAVVFPEAGTQIKVLMERYVSTVLQQIANLK